MACIDIDSLAQYERDAKEGRADALYKANALTQSDYDAAKAQYDSTQGAVATAQAAVAQAQQALADCELRAPLEMSRRAGLHPESAPWPRSRYKAQDYP